ncbi:MAG: hypothetical protein K9L25_04595 [Methylovulum sp.]|jgi:hypothetical protein|nr:hypothetical protein [Methylovulum sp.]
MKTTLRLLFLSAFTGRLGVKKSSVSRQQGVVLVVSLVILLLLTLLSVNMIQQNRLEFMMAGNAQMQSQAFSSAESLLKITENFIDTWHGRYRIECRDPITNDPVSPTQVAYQCYNLNMIPYGHLEVLELEPNQTIPEKLFHCLTPEDSSASNPNSDPSLGGLTADTELEDLQAMDEDPSTVAWEITHAMGLDTNGVGIATGATVSITSIACLNSETNQEIVFKDDTQNGVLGYANGHNSVSTSCASLIYAIKAVSIPTGTFAERSVESKYAVRCDKFTFHFISP